MARTLDWARWICLHKQHHILTVFTVALIANIYQPLLCIFMALKALCEGPALGPAFLWRINFMDKEQGLRKVSELNVWCWRWGEVVCNSHRADCWQPIRDSGTGQLCSNKMLAGWPAPACFLLSYLTISYLLLWREIGRLRSEFLQTIVQFSCRVQLSCSADAESSYNELLWRTTRQLCLLQL